MLSEANSILNFQPMTAGRTDDKIFGIVLTFKMCHGSEGNLLCGLKDFLNTIRFQNWNLLRTVLKTVISFLQLRDYVYNPFKY